jgi:hypothetical protein
VLVLGVLAAVAVVESLSTGGVESGDEVELTLIDPGVRWRLAGALGGVDDVPVVVLEVVVLPSLEDTVLDGGVRW